jgi:hypothetical protein
LRRALDAAESADAEEPVDSLGRVEDAQVSQDDVLEPEDTESITDAEPLADATPLADAISTADALSGDGEQPGDDVNASADTDGSNDVGLLDVSVEDASLTDAGLDATELGDVAADDTAVEDIAPEPSDTGMAADVLEPLDITEPDASPQVPLYLLSVNNSLKRLEKIDVQTGQGTVVCNLPSNTNYPSLTFSRDNVLFASYQGSTLHTIDPCTCAVQVVGPYGGFSGVNGITSDFGVNLFGVSHIQDEFISIDSNTGGGTSIGDLGVNFGYTGATWSDGDEMVYAIDALSDSLFKIDPETGLATFVAPLSLPMGTVGIEMHPDNGVLYACSDPAHLLSIDLVTGEVTDIGDMGQNTACNNLAAPWAPVPCLDSL